MSVGHATPGVVVKAHSLGLAGLAQLRPDLLGRLGHHGSQHQRGQLQLLSQQRQHRVETRGKRLVLAQLPGHRLVDVFVGASDHAPQRLERVVELIVVHELAIFGELFERLRFHFVVERFVRSRRGHHAAAILLDHRHRAAEQIAQVVGKVGVDALHQRQLREVAVEAKRHLAEQEVAEHVAAIERDHLVRIDDVALRLGHLLAVARPPAVRVHAGRRRQAEGQQHDRPDDAVEADDVLAHKVIDHGPVLVHLRLVRAVAARGEVVDERVEPDVDRVVLIAGNGDAPRHAGAGDRLILQPHAQEADDFVVTHLRLDRVGVLLIELEQLIGIGRRAQEVALLLHLFERTVAVGAGMVLALAGLGHVRLARHAVPALVRSLINIALVEQLFEDRLYSLDVTLLRRADEVVVRRVDQRQQITEVLRQQVGEMLRSHALLRGALADLLAVLVGAGQKEHVIAAHALVARHRISGDRRVGVPDVGHVVDVVNGRSDVEILVCHKKFLQCQKF